MFISNLACFFHCCGSHRDLHSFPTRRSSDLALGVENAFALDLGRMRGQYRDDERVARSEEHTSELQSPYDLVCRLLLEKKNKRDNIHKDLQTLDHAISHPLLLTLLPDLDYIH